MVTTRNKASLESYNCTVNSTIYARLQDTKCHKRSKAHHSRAAAMSANPLYVVPFLSQSKVLNIHKLSYFPVQVVITDNNSMLECQCVVETLVGGHSKESYEAVFFAVVLFLLSLFNFTILNFILSYTRKQCTTNNQTLFVHPLQSFVVSSLFVLTSVCR